MNLFSTMWKWWLLKRNKLWLKQLVDSFSAKKFTHFQRKSRVSKILEVIFEGGQRILKRGENTCWYYYILFFNMDFSNFIIVCKKTVLISKINKNLTG